MKKTAIIIGGTSGIGLGLAKLLVINKYNLILVGRNKKKLKKAKNILKEISNVNIETYCYDLEINSDLNSLKQKILNYKGKITFVTNTLGSAFYGNFLESNNVINNNIINSNINIFIDINKFFIKYLLKHKMQSYIVCIGSLAGFVPNYNNLIYACSKKFVEKFTYSLRENLKYTNVSISLVAPGKVNTNFIKKNKIKTDKSKPQDVDDLAKIIFKNVLLKKKLIIPGLKNKIRYFVFKFFPDSIVYKIYFFLEKYKS